MTALQLRTETARNIFLPLLSNATTGRGYAATPTIPGKILIMSLGMTALQPFWLHHGYGMPDYTFVGLENQVETTHASDVLNYALENARAKIVFQQSQVSKNAGAVALLTSWLDGMQAVDEEQKETLVYLKRVLDEDRPSSRKLFE